MTRLLLVRHGQTESNVRGLLDTAEPGAALTDLGREQSTGLIARFAGERIDRIVVSNLLRTRQTAAPLADALGLQPIVDARLREIEAADLELRADRDAHRTYLGTVFSWARGERSATVPGGREDADGFFERFDAGVEAAVANADTVVIVSHGASIRTWASVRAENLPLLHGAEHGLPNTGLVVLERSVGSWRAIEWHEQRFGDLDADPTGAAVRR